MKAFCQVFIIIFNVCILIILNVCILMLIMLIGLILFTLLWPSITHAIVIHII